MNYDQLIAKKLPRQHCAGFDPVLPVNPMLFGWQREVLTWALRVGRAALFLDCGLGKSPIQLEWGRQVMAKTGKPVLGLCPLGPSEQIVEEAAKFGIPAKRVHTIDDMEDGKLCYTNFQRLHLFESIIPDLGGVIVDEASILKNFAGTTAQRFIELFANVPHRLANTATPSPNDYEEIGTQAEFLGHGTRFEMLSTFFIHDSANTAEWRLKKHARKAFWEWVATWAACISKPSDIGYSDEGYDLPPLNIVPVWVDVDQSADSETGDLIRMPELSASKINGEMRLTIPERVERLRDIIGGIKGKWVIWCNLNAEQDAIEEMFKGRCVSVRGSDKEDDKIGRERQWRLGDIPGMVSKGEIFGQGMNWQHCHDVVYFPSYSFEDLYQCIRRVYRFGQKHPVNVYLVIPKTASQVIQVLNRKMDDHKRMQDEMRIAARAIKTTTNSKPMMNTKTESVKTETWELHHGDAVRVAKKIPAESVGFSIYSPPFANLYVYSADVQDMGNCASNDEFIEQYRFLIKEKFRITQTGRLSAVHCSDLPAQIWKDGYSGFKDFSAQIVSAHLDEGWLWHCPRITIWKDPVVEMQRTKALGLLYKQLRKDSCKSRVGNPDYLLVFKKPGENENAVEHDTADYPVDQWQRDASPVWMDIDQTNVLSRDGAREQNDERHICPLQLDVIRRAMRLWSKKGDLVYSPFVGIASEGFCAIEMGRRFVGSELKRSYFDQAVAHLKMADREAVSVFEFAK